jgi:hypothetical protein
MLVEGLGFLQRLMRHKDDFGRARGQLAPLVEAPACTTTGRPWGERATLSGPRTWKCAPWWCSAWSLSGSR